MKKLILQSLIFMFCVNLFAKTYTYADFNKSDYVKVKDAYDLEETFNQTKNKNYFFTTKLMDYKVDDYGNQIVKVLTSSPVDFELIHKGDQLPKCFGMDENSVIIYVHQEWNFDDVIFVIDAIETLPHKFVFDTTYITTSNLYLREGQGTSSKKITMLEKGSFVYILEVGKEETIDGITSNWVKIKEDTEGWCFGGYLEYSR